MSSSLYDTLAFISPFCSHCRQKKENVVYLHTMQYYSALKGKEILTYAATWINLEDIVLSGISQRKTNIVWHHLYEGYMT